MRTVTHWLSLISAVALLLVATAARGEDVDLFIMAGQSNMQGWQGDAGKYPCDKDRLDRTIRFYWVTPGFSSSEGKWTYLQPQGGRFPRGHFGPEVGFARLLAADGRKVAIFKYSLGATSIARNWRGPGGGGLYDDMVKHLHKAIGLLEAQELTVRPRAFVWIQGESDAENDQMAAAYYERLKKMIHHLRTEVLKDKRLPVILGVDEQHPWVKERPLIVEDQKRLASEDPWIVFTSMIGLEKADSTHLTPAALVKHGQRLYEAFKKLERKQKQTGKEKAEEPQS